MLVVCLSWEGRALWAALTVCLIPASFIFMTYMHPHWQILACVILPNITLCMPPLAIGSVQTHTPLSRKPAHTLSPLQASNPDVLGQGPDLEWELLTVLGFLNDPYGPKLLGKL